MGPIIDEIKHFVREHYQLWNEQKREELLALCDAIAPNGYTIEYVGRPVQDGRQGWDEMFAHYGGKVRTDIKLLIANGDEVATQIDNVFVGEDRNVPSLETYRVADGKLAIRYFHREAPRTEDQR